MTDTTLISDLTVAEFRDLVSVLLYNTPHRREQLRGISGIAEALSISISQAKRVKAEGLIDGALTQSGRVILVDVERARQLYRESTKSKRRNFKHLYE